jgi:hypothetical protein
MSDLAQASISPRQADEANPRSGISLAPTVSASSPRLTMRIGACSKLAAPSTAHGTASSVCTT